MYLQELPRHQRLFRFREQIRSAVRILVCLPRSTTFPELRAFRALAGKGLGEQPLGGHSKSQTSRAGEGRNLFFDSETPADPSFLCLIVVWLWRGRGMIWLAGDVLLYGFLALPDGLLNFLFGGYFLSRGKGGIFLGEFLC
jgi:hypothetical protein